MPNELFRLPQCLWPFHPVGSDSTICILVDDNNETESNDTVSPEDSGEKLLLADMIKLFIESPARRDILVK